MVWVNTKSIFLSLIFLGVILEVIGDIFIKKWSLNDRILLLVIGVIIYFTGSIFWIISLRHGYLSKAISIFTLLNLILIALAGIFIFHEKLSFVNRVGVFIGLVSIIMIEFF